MSETETLLTFPCDFTLKVFGVATDTFEGSVLDSIRKHVPHLSETACKNRPSKDGKYHALSITVHVESKAQLDAIYLDLTSSSFALLVI